MSGDCWIWQGSTTPNGYGMIRDRRKRTSSGATGQSLVHRVMYEAEFGAVPEGAHVHHTCKQRACVNPAHLTAVTPQEHRATHAAEVTHCPQGHEYTAANMLRGPTRACRECSRERHRMWVAANVHPCPDCGKPIGPSAKRCRNCHLARVRPTTRGPRGWITSG